MTYTESKIMFEKSVYNTNLKQIISTLSDKKFENFVISLMHATFPVNLIPLPHALLV